MATLIGKNEGIEYVHRMVNQRSSGQLDYPSETNIRGNAKPGHRDENSHVAHLVSHGPDHTFISRGARKGREHHAKGDVVGGGAHDNAMMGPSSEAHRRGGDVGRKRSCHADGDMVQGQPSPVIGQGKPIQPVAMKHGGSMKPKRY